MEPETISRKATHTAVSTISFSFPPKFSSTLLEAPGEPRAVGYTSDSAQWVDAPCCEQHIQDHAVQEVCGLGRQCKGLGVQIQLWRVHISCGQNTITVE
ncbi:unnamed protein product [Lepidochelys olivacea]